MPVMPGGVAVISPSAAANCSSSRSVDNSACSPLRDFDLQLDDERASGPSSALCDNAFEGGRARTSARALHFARCLRRIVTLRAGCLQCRRSAGTARGRSAREWRRGLPTPSRNRCLMTAGLSAAIIAAPAQLGAARLRALSPIAPVKAMNGKTERPHNMKDLNE